MGIDHSDDSSDDGLPDLPNGFIIRRAGVHGDDDDTDDVMDSDDDDDDEREGGGRGSLRRCTHQ